MKKCNVTISYNLKLQSRYQASSFYPGDIGFQSKINNQKPFPHKPAPGWT